MKEPKEFWIRFGEHGNATHDTDWSCDELRNKISFGDDRFYTYYSFEPKTDGIHVIEKSAYDNQAAKIAALEEEIATLKKYYGTCCAERDTLIEKLKSPEPNNNTHPPTDDESW